MSLGLSLWIKLTNILFKQAPICRYSGRGGGGGGVCLLFIFLHLLGSGGLFFSFLSFLLDNSLSEVT